MSGNLGLKEEEYVRNQYQDSFLWGSFYNTLNFSLEILVFLSHDIDY